MILVTGATGFIGRRLTAALDDRGYEVAVLSRQPRRAQERVPRVRLVEAWNPLSEPAPLHIIERAQGIVHLAGETVAGRWTEARKRAIRDSRVQGTRNLVAAMAQ
ncbi:MAG: NAD-dependent epimerase/dehydratase family protein, partial [Acidobacteria bacterium]